MEDFLLPDKGQPAITSLTINYYYFSKSFNLPAILSFTALLNISYEFSTAAEFSV